MEVTEFILRDFSTDDISSLTENANNLNVVRNLRDTFPFPYTEKDAKGFIEEFIPNTSGKIFAIDVEGKAVGAIGVLLFKDEYRMTAELGYWLGEKYWNKGIITKAVEKITDFAFKNFEIHKIYAKVYNYNEASCKVLLKNGYELEARLVENVIKNGVFADELIYAKFRD